MPECGLSRIWRVALRALAGGVWLSAGLFSGQALALVNDPFVALCAERFGARALARAGDDSARIAWMYEVAFTRPPSAHELASALDFVASVGDDAQERVLAFTDLAHTLYQLEEFAWLP